MEMIRSLEILPDPPTPPFLDAPAASLDVRPLLEARAQADLPVQAWSMDSDVELPADSPFQRITYRSDELELKAFLSTPDAVGPHPAVLWVEGGFGGPAVPWERGPVEDDQSAMDFVEAGFVVLAPSFRGELDNPGEIGPFYGETTDLLNALAHLRTLDGVDPRRIYLVGHSTGGTNVLLAAAAGAEARATVVFGGRAVVEPDLYELPVVLSDEGARLRSALHWADDLTHPVYYLGGDNEWLVDGAAMARAATEAGRTMTVHPVPRTDHFTMLTPARRVLIPKMLADDPSGPPFTVTEPELLAAVVQTWPATEGPPSAP
jgi:dienelactone hydrolase